ncbi:MAG: polysaccharide deacetylase family protein [Clostridia bacterium]|nr:polysaccharide deacetylase family protein [Clostridia bacterium]
MKKFTALLTAAALLLALPLSASALSAKGLSWYIHREKGSTSPSVMPEASAFFSSYDGIFMGDPAQKTVYLTFDAGYDNGNMPLILDTLRDKGVFAAFFLDGNFVKRNAELVRRIADEGHLVCNHTLNHPDMTKYSTLEQYSAQITGWEELVTALGVTPSKFLRPPSGLFSEQTLAFDRQLGYKTVFWSAAYLDWDVNKQMAPSEALPKLMSRVHNGAVVLLHSVSSTNAKILPQFIDALRADGYSFGSLEEL